MPFSNRGGYPEPRIRKLLLNKVHEKANALLIQSGQKRRTFAPLSRVDGGAAGAVVITDQIVTDILGCHFFLGDMTGCNFGVVLETGIALALKPNGRVVLFTQDDTASLHFDLKVTKVNRYTEIDLVTRAAEALVCAAEVFEGEADRYIRLLSSQLTPDAIMLLNLYGRSWKDMPQGLHPSFLTEKTAGRVDHFIGESGRVAFYDCIRELSARRLVWTDFRPNSPPGCDSYEIHATRLGWTVIEHLWQHDKKMRMRKGAPTGPNLM